MYQMRFNYALKAGVRSTRYEELLTALRLEMVVSRLGRSDDGDARSDVGTPRLLSRGPIGSSNLAHLARRVGERPVAQGFEEQIRQPTN
jgi:hypothetical protein